MRNWCLTIAFAAAGCGGTPPPSPIPPTPVATPTPAPAPAPDAEAGPEPAPVPEQPPPPPPKPALPITVVAVGDMMLGSTFPDTTGKRLPPNGGRDLLAQVTPILSAADVAFGNLESPMIEGGGSGKCARMKKKRRGGKQTCWAFRQPTAYAKLLAAAGFDVVSIANNHAMDFGQEGRDSTKKALDDAGIAHSAEPGSTAELTVKGRTIGLVAFATANHSHNLNDIDAARTRIAAAAAKYDLVIVSFHGGAEGRRHQRVPYGNEKFYGENRGDLRAFTHAVVDAGADLVLGHGPHVVRGMEIYKGRLIAYSLGNFATYRGFSLKGPAGFSYILEARLGAEGELLGGTVHPIRQPYPGGPVLDPKRTVLPSLRELSKSDFGDAGVVIADDLTFAPPAP